MGAGMGAGTEEIHDAAAGTTWRFDRDFLGSRWTCLWGRGCLGIGTEPAPELGLGCCSVGAELGDVDEARMIAALAATLRPDLFEHRAEATEGFGGGAGCALHLAAIDAGEPPLDWKPSVCWQLPIKVDWEEGESGTEVATVRRWSRQDWGPEGRTMAWCCTEGQLAYVGDRPVIESLGAELEELVGTEVFVELRRRMTR